MAKSLDVTVPRPRTSDGPIIDSHVHLGDPRAGSHLVRAGRRYDVEWFVAICRLADVRRLRRRFGRSLLFNIWLNHDHRDDAARFAAVNRDLVFRAADLGCVSMKFWYKPEFNEQTGFYFDDPRLDPVFEAMRQAGLSALVHIADPDVWWRHRYADPQRFEAKRFTYRQLTNTLGRYPDLRVQVAHMGGNPEDLAFLDGLLRRYPNCYLDTSATKWVVRELGRQPQRARDFFITHADRLLFGTDLVAFRHATFEHHCSRYWVHRFLYEQAGVVPSPIDDADATGPVHIVGFDLPPILLRRLYFENAVEFYRLRERGVV